MLAWTCNSSELEAGLNSLIRIEWYIPSGFFMRFHMKGFHQLPERFLILANKLWSLKNWTLTLVRNLFFEPSEVLEKELKLKYNAFVTSKRWFRKTIKAVNWNWHLAFHFSRCSVSLVSESTSPRNVYVWIWWSMVRGKVEKAHIPASPLSVLSLLRTLFLLNISDLKFPEIVSVWAFCQPLEHPVNALIPTQQNIL